MGAPSNDGRLAAGDGLEMEGRALCRVVRFALALLLGALAGTPTALGQGDSPRFHGAPEGGPLLQDVCRVRGLVQGGVLNFVNPVAEANRRREKVRGIATTLVTLQPERTHLTLLLVAEGDSAAVSVVRLEGKRAAVEAALTAAGFVIIERAVDSALAELPPPDLDHAPFIARMKLVLGLEGAVDPLAAMAAMPPDAVTALERVDHQLPGLAAVVHPVRAELEAEASEDAAARAAARGEGIAIGKRVKLEFSPDERRFPFASAGHRMLPVSAIATHVLSRPPGSTAVSE